MVQEHHDQYDPQSDDDDDGDDGNYYHAPFQANPVVGLQHPLPSLIGNAIGWVKSLGFELLTGLLDFKRK